MSLNNEIFVDKILLKTCDASLNLTRKHRKSSTAIADLT